LREKRSAERAVLRADARFAFCRRHSWIFTLHEQLRVGHFDATPNTIDRTGTCWRQEIGFESYFRRGKRGAAMYARYMLDDMPTVQDLPIFSKDQLLEIGISFFN
jgi:hypothetical protein